MLVYTSRRDWVLETDAATFARQHDPDAAERDVDDALERLERAGLMNASGKPTELRLTLRGHAFLHELHEARHEPAAYGRARQLFAGQTRPNPSQASFSWAGDPRQLTMSFDAPPKPSEPEASPEARAAFGRSSAEQMRAAKPKRKRSQTVTFPSPKGERVLAAAERKLERAHKQAHKQRHPYGAPIVFDGSGNLPEESYRAWAVRWSRGEGVQPPIPSHDHFRNARNLLLTFNRFEGTGREAKAWREFWKEWERVREASSHWISDADSLRMQWEPIVVLPSAREAADYAARNGLPDSDRSEFLGWHKTIQEARQAESPSQETIAWERAAEARAELFNKWTDKPYRGHERQNPEPRSVAAKQARRGEREAAQAEIRRARGEQQRARAERKKELHQTSEQTKRIRGKVTAASRSRRERIRARAWDRIDRANERIAELRAQKAWTAGKAPRRGHGRVWEQNEAVEAEIRHVDPLLVPLWRKHRADFKGTPHERTERFFEWVEEQSEADIWEAVERTLPTDRQLAASYEAWAAEQSA